MREFVADDRNVGSTRRRAPSGCRRSSTGSTTDFLDYERVERNAIPTVVDYVNRYRAADQRIPAGLRVRFLDYDKRLNRQAPPP